MAEPGARYQNAPRDQVVLVSDLAGAARRAGRGLQADRRAAAPAPLRRRCCRRSKDRDLVVLHTSTPSFASDVKTVRALKAAQSESQDRHDRRQGRGRCRRHALQACEELDFVARNEFDFTVKEVAEGRDFGSINGLSYRDARRPHRPQRPSAPILHNMDELPFVSPVYKRDLDDRELLHRLSAAPVSVVLHRPRLQIALHLLPVAADRRRPRLPHAQRRPRHRRAEVGQAGVSAGQGILLRRRHADRRPAARRRARPRDRQARHHLGVQRQGQRAAQDP